MRAIDLFAGLGWGIACHQLHIHECGAELVPEVRLNRQANNMCNRWRDVTELPDTVAAGFPLLIASPPCQTFSRAGAGHGRDALSEVMHRAAEMVKTGVLDRTGGDPRTWLVIEPLRIVLGSQPDYVVFEQVPSVLTFWDYCAEELRTWGGYSTWTGILSAEAYDVPQARKRAFLIARKDGLPAVPPPPVRSRYYSSGKVDQGLPRWLSMADQLGWGMTHRPSMTVTSGGTDTGGAEPFGHQARAAMRAEAEAGRWLGPVPDKIGRISAADAAALQTLPSWFQWAGTNGKRMQQIGNAVPVNLARHVLSVFEGDDHS